MTKERGRASVVSKPGSRLKARPPWCFLDYKLNRGALQEGSLRDPWGGSLINNRGSAIPPPLSSAPPPRMPNHRDRSCINSKPQRGLRGWAHPPSSFPHRHGCHQAVGIMAASRQGSRHLLLSLSPPAVQHAIPDFVVPL